jgi:hypothetical protein
MPELKNSNIIKNECNTRPCRTTLRIEQENFITDNGKVFPVVHHYGHGYCGVSMWYFSFINFCSYGSANEAFKIISSIKKSKL